MILDTELSSNFNSVIDHLKNTCKQVNASGQALVIIHNGKIVTDIMKAIIQT